MTWLRALFAAGLSVLLPGAGHALLRDWLRAAMFAGLYIAAVVLFFPLEQIADQAAAAESMSEAMDVATAETDRMTQFMLSFLALFAAIDATFRALGFPPTADSSDGPSCPECGKEIDEDLEFCHWCTARLEPETRDEPARS